jgi:hypothetical protein
MMSSAADARRPRCHGPSPLANFSAPRARSGTALKVGGGPWPKAASAGGESRRELSLQAAAAAELGTQLQTRADACERWSVVEVR